MPRIAALLAALFARTAVAQPQTYMEKDVPAPAAVDASKPQGFSPKLKVGSNVSYNHSRKVVGSPDGSTFVIGALIEGALEWRRGQHEWQNTLAINEAQSKNPLLDDFVKSLDTIELKSIYLYHLVKYPWLGPFARVRLQSSLFPGYYVNDQGKDVDVIRTLRNGTSPDRDRTPLELGPQERFRLTDPFEPLLLRESVGAFANAVDKSDLKASFKLGPGAQQTIVANGFVLTEATAVPDDPNTTSRIEEFEVRLTQLRDTSELGVEAEAEASGKIAEGVTWSLLVNALQPLYESVDSGRDGLDRMNLDVQGKLTVKLSSWASLDYILLVRRAPTVVDEVQVTNGLLFSASFEAI